MAQLACVIIDDDEISRLTLERYVEQSPDLILLASISDAMEALRFLQNEGERTEVMFLDVQMPLLSGLELLRLLPDPPQVVLTTGRPDFAVEAFELRVVDYLVKPIEFARFRQAVARVQQRIGASMVPGGVPAAAAPAPTTSQAALFVKSNNRLVRVPLEEILYVEAVTGYAVVVTTRQQILSNQSIKELAERLPEAQFPRVHRSYVVNRERIEAVEDNTIYLAGGRSLPIGKTYLSEFLNSLKT